MQNDAKAETTFESLYKSLNPAQKRAVDAIEGPVMVIAGPGTGKTTILTLRIANILRETQTAPDSILALTFTESGAYAMRRKLVEIIGAAAYRVNIHTFHGFASQIIEKYPDYFPRIIGSTIITESEQFKIVENIIRSKKIKLLRPYGDQNYYVGPILREIQILKRENISPARLRSQIKLEMSGEPMNGRKSDTEKEKLEKQNAKNIELAYVYDQYEKALAKNKYYDFEDMLLELIHAMEDSPEFKLILQEEYQYILADEHQDANTAQNRILELLSDFHQSPNLFIVGDDKQAIYRFQGASLENFLYFKEKYQGAQVIDLEHNYRSHQGILDAAHSLITKNPTIPGRERKKLISLQMGSAPVFVIECATINDELECVAGLIDKMIKRGKKAEEIAILYRDNKHAEPISAALKARGVEHRIESDYDIMAEPDAVKIVILCKAIRDPSDSEALAGAFFLPELDLDSGEVAEACKESTMNKQPLYRIVKKYSQLNKAYERIAKWNGESQTAPFPQFLQKLIQETNMIASVVSAPNSLSRLDAVQSFYDHVEKAARSKKTFYLKDFIEQIDVAKEHGVKSKRNYAEFEGGVRLMTAHRAKGLEFDHVFIIHCDDGVWGNRSARNLFHIPAIEHARNSGRIEDERRLFYVAMTRAREAVHMIYSLSDGEREMIPSQFLSEIDPALVAFEKLGVDSISAHTYRLFQNPEQMCEVSILKPEFVRAKFLAQPFSVTHLNNYLECPWRYFFVNLIRVPQTENKHQMYGTAVHATLRTLFDAYKEGRDLGKKRLLDLFKHNIEKQPMGADDRRESLEKGKKALSGYYDEYSGKWNVRLITEYAVKGTELAFGNGQKLQLTGKLDKIEFADDKNVTVVDYKTGKPRSKNEIAGKTKEGDGNYMRQLIFYKLLLSDSRLKMRYGEIDFVEPNVGGKYKKERFEISDEEVVKLKKQIEKVAQEIAALKFIGEKCDDKDCEYCKLGKLLRDK
ncbi:DEAD/DEAH box helicase [Patescibacteria group bacterium]|nr:DEAD/DEAH box helicase [Patescibacteria group bacterium]MDE1946356.1 ATP-dependent helicase [Patescibacteria group bacterium]MDE2010808.1 ATP-dependent helicase [Patescibacteria group bacterium]MDE2233259.1 ATP-dependent helicase [Patescibacteria group bacterium]